MKFLLRELLPPSVESYIDRLVAHWKIHRARAQKEAMAALKVRFQNGLEASGREIEAAKIEAAEAAEHSEVVVIQAMHAKEDAEAEAARLRARQEVLREELREGVGEIDSLRKKLEVIQHDTHTARPA